jgi:PKHD-type hydroxylase
MTCIVEYNSGQGT